MFYIETYEKSLRLEKICCNKGGGGGGGSIALITMNYSDGGYGGPRRGLQNTYQSNSKNCKTMCRRSVEVETFDRMSNCCFYKLYQSKTEIKVSKSQRMTGTSDFYSKQVWDYTKNSVQWYNWSFP